MKKFYKYYTFNDNFWNSLKESYFWMTDPTDLNDPFEAYVEYYTNASNEEKIEWAINRKLIKPGINNLSEEQCLKIAESVLTYQQTKRNEYELKERKSFGICALTTKPQNLLMWSHYGNSHRGICLGFESIEEGGEYFLPLENDLKIPLYRVKYKKFSSRYDFLKEDIIEYKNCIFEKHPNWSYENEYRLVMVNGEYLDNKQLRKTYYQKKCLSEVVFGCKTSADDINAFLNTINAFGIKLKKIRKLKLNPKSMRLVYDKDFSIERIK